MTENEAIEKLKNMRLYMQITDKNNDCKFTEDDYKANEMAIQALEKQIPKKPVKSEKQVVRYVNTYYCPICNLGITGTNIAKWCYHCGQKLDWSDEE
jgi:hypothetical protein